MAVYVKAHTTALQLERELQLITDVSNWSHQEKFDYYKPKIMAFATEEAIHSPKMKRILVTHAAELEAVSDGMFVYMYMIAYMYNSYTCMYTLCVHVCVNLQATNYFWKWCIFWK